MGKVDYIISDSPLYIQAYYMPHDYPKEFADFAMAMSKKYQSENIFLQRNHEYDPNGRVHSEEESLLISNDLEKMMRENGIDYIKLFASETTAQHVYDTMILPSHDAIHRNNVHRLEKLA
jgi:mitochondrial fission protein ELM1